MENINNKKNKWIGAIVVVIIIVLGFWYSSSRYDAGYEAAIADIKAQQAEAGDKAAKAATDEANPFKVENPLQGVEANPFEKAKKTLNPFD
ncbi:MAG: hypothetical protein AAB687_01560 [Patescibacteria group bacterium]